MQRASLFLSLLLAPILLIALAVGAALLMLNTETGTRLLAGRASAALGGMVSWQEVQGPLTGPLLLRGIEVRQPGLALELDTLAIDWSPTALAGRQLQVESLQAEGLRVTLSETDPDPAAEPFDPATLQLPVAISLNDVRLGKITIVQAGQEPIAIDSVRLRAELDDGLLTLHELAVEAPLASLALSGSADLAGGPSISLDYQLAVHETGLEVPGELGADGRLTVSLATDAADLELTAAMEDSEVLVRGRVAWTPHVQWDLHIEGDRLDPGRFYPDMPGSISLRVTTAGQLPEGEELAATVSVDRLQGTLLDYPLDLTTRLAVQGETAQIEQLALASGANRIEARGRVGWSPTANWDLLIEGDDLDPASFYPDLPGDVSLRMQTAGQVMEDGGLQATAAVEQLQGTLLDRPLDMTARLALLGETVQIEDLALASSENRVRARGLLSTAPTGPLEIDWEVEAPDPGALAPAARGHLAARGRASGTLEAPIVQLTLQGTDLQWESLSTPRLELEALAGMGMEDPLELALDTGPVTDGGSTLLENLQLNASGSLAGHELTLRAAAPGQAVRTLLRGAVTPTRDGWQGQLVETDVTTADFGEWHQVKPADLALAMPAAASLAESCFTDAAGALVCAAGRWQEGGGDIEARLQGLEISRWLPEISGEAGGELVAGLAADGTLSMRGKLRLGEGQVTARVGEDKRLLSHGGGELDAVIDGRGLVANAWFKAPEQGSLDINLGMPALRALPLAQDQPLQGTVRATLPSLEGFAAWVPELSSAGGRLDADLQIAGTLEQPLILGQLQLRDGAAELPLAGVKLQQVEVLAVSDGDAPGQLTLNGSMRSGGGTMALQGRANLIDATADLSLNGKRFQVFNTADLRATVSPDLRIGWADNTLKLRGDLLIPEAAITPQVSLVPSVGSPGEPAAPGQVIPPSPDVVVVNGPVPVEDSLSEIQAPFRIDSQVRVILGDKVDINAMGFISGISGAVTFTNKPEQVALLPMAKGRFDLEHGTFRSFGQDLDIETGQIIFADVPADEPELNIRAVRWIDSDPTVSAAGVLVTGSLTQPSLDLFSRPQLDPSEVQTYLLTGRSSGSKDNVLSIGTYVSPRIYVGYGYNMLERTSEFNSLFSISPRYGFGANLGEADNNLNVTFSHER